VIKAVIAKIATYPISVDDVKIANYDWSDEFDAQIALTMKIAQESKQAEQELKKVEFSAQTQVIQAQANFDAEKLNAEAKKAE
jgi:regulator of protease activity HflC (stomatin/prohibitin superfamily)